MEVRLNNIGIISESTIEIDGLTVVTGHNNSGKTTVGKVLYAIISAVEDLHVHALVDKTEYALPRIRLIIWQFLNYFDGDKKTLENQRPGILSLLHGNSLSIKNIDDLLELTDKIIEEIQKISYEDLYKMAEDVPKRERLQDKEEQFLEKRKNVINELNKLRIPLASDPALIEYANTKISKFLNLEFNEQILPVSAKNTVGEVLVRDSAERLYYNLRIKDNRIEPNEWGFFESPFERVVFLDDVAVLDSMAEFTVAKDIPFIGNSSFDKSIGIQTHHQHLLKKLKREPDNVFEEIVNAQSAKEVLGKINAIFPDEVVQVNGKYVCSNSKLDVRNLAAGSKMFAIIKMLLEKGELDHHTLLLLDEPEAHLHPEWQNYFAEVIVLLIKYLKVTVLLTTHSPNFLMAIEMFSKKYGIWAQTNIYSTGHREDSVMVQYQNVKACMQKAYAKLANPLFEIQRELNKLEE